MQDIDSKFIGRMGSKMGFFALAYAEMKKRGLGYEFPHSMEYWEEYLPDLKKLFQPGIIPSDRVGIHVRRGDFLKPSCHAAALPSSYYIKAIERYKYGDFLIFAETYDPFVEKLHEFAGGQYHEGNEVDAFNRLAGCKHLIIANSSFSYWAGLMHQQKGDVSYPSQWAKNGWAPKVPTNWIKIQCL